MNYKLRIFLIVSILVYLSIIIHFLKQKRLNLKYTLLWLFSVFIMLIVTIFPQIMDFVAKLVGIETPVNLVFFLEGMFVVLILLTLTVIVSHLTNRVYRLTQSLAILEKKLGILSK